MFRYERPVRFEDVDAAQIVFFPRFFNYCHEAMEALFGALDGGYVALITRRRIGLPAVHVACDFRAPLVYGDVARIDITVPQIGATSCTFRYEVSRAVAASERRREYKDAAPIAVVTHTCVLCQLGPPITKIAIPDDVRAVLEAHRG